MGRVFIVAESPVSIRQFAGEEADDTSSTLKCLIEAKWIRRLAAFKFLSIGFSQQILPKY